MNLIELIESIVPTEGLANLSESLNRPVRGLTLDSREVKPGYLFFANQPALAQGGEAYIEQALELGAAAVFYEAKEAPPAVKAMGLALSGYPIISLVDYRQIIGQIASRYYGHPSRHLKVIAVTGTNGKTSTTYFIAKALQAYGYSCGLIGTLGWGFPDTLGEVPLGNLTTPDVISVHRLLAALRDQGAQAVAMEVSSHGIVQERVAGVVFETAIFTNLSREHLDYHKTFEDYAEAKARLFRWPELKQVIVNHDDAMGRELAVRCLADGKKVYTYGCTRASMLDSNIKTVHAEPKTTDRFGLTAAITLSDQTECLFNPLLIGAFTLSNLLAVLWILRLEGADFSYEILPILSKLGAVPGRMEALDYGFPLPLVVVDYAHTPDAIEKSLKALRPLCHAKAKLWCLLGCGGERDQGKRPLMGEVAEKYSDRIVLTNDNVRSEEPHAIIADIQSGLSEVGQHKTTVELNRGVAIAEAIRQATPDDIVLIAGKGHENYQLFKGHARYFSDKMQAITALYKRQMMNSSTAQNSESVVSSLESVVQRLELQGLLKNRLRHPVGKTLSYRSVSIDTRTLEPGDLFFAIKGPQFDGHDFVSQAEKKGAVALVTHRPVENVSIPEFRVRETTTALGAVGRLIRDSVDIPVVGLTGSCGKTTTKELIASIFAQVGRVTSTQGNLNNYYGVPLTLLNLNKGTDFAVIEMGANQPGEIAYLTQLVCPTVALITNASAAHLEGFKTIEGVAKTKGAIYEGLTPDGIAVINADDEYAGYWRTVAATYSILTFGINALADVRADHIQIDPSTGHVSFILSVRDQTIPVQLALIGRHNVMNALAASAAAFAVGLDLEIIKKGLEAAQARDKRLVRYQTASGAIVIDDTYNANPLSMQAALAVLAEHPGRKIFVMGDMGELGSGAKDYHVQMGEVARHLGIDYLLTQGVLSKEASLAFGSSAYHFNNSQSLLSALRSLLDETTMVVIKGSRAARMETIVAGIVSVPVLS